MDWVPLLVLWLVCGLACGWIAQQRDTEPVGWFVTGVILGPFGVLAALVFAKPDGPPCPHCGKRVAPDRKIRCDNCGLPLDTGPS